MGQPHLNRLFLEERRRNQSRKELVRCSTLQLNQRSKMNLLKRTKRKRKRKRLSLLQLSYQKNPSPSLKVKKKKKKKEEEKIVITPAVLPKKPESESESEEEEEEKPAKKKLSKADLKPAVQIKMAAAPEPPISRRKK